MAALKRYFRVVFFMIVVFFFIICFQILARIQNEEEKWDLLEGGLWFEKSVDYGGRLLVGEDELDEHDRDNIAVSEMDIKVPIILWWTPFTGERGKVKQCKLGKCFFTVDRHFKDHPKTQVFVFYGTDFSPKDLPLPRKTHHEWALLHEESPKNNFLLSHEPVLNLFNHTATFRRHSDYPLTTQYLEKLQDFADKTYFVPTKTKNSLPLSPVVYVHADCDPPSDRDSYVKELMQYIDVDAYGHCLHNKDLPKRLQDPLTLFDSDYYKIMAQYKFTLAFENAVCEDYITEKLWRPLHLGSVPVYFGSPSIKEWLPTNRSAIHVSDFSGPKELAEFLTKLNNDDVEYEKYLDHKFVNVTNEKLIKHMKAREWGVNDFTQMNFIDGFECFVCNRIHRDMTKRRRNFVVRHVATKEHYGCPRPKLLPGFKNQGKLNFWQQMYDNAGFSAKALNHYVLSGRNMSYEEYLSYIDKLRIEQEGKRPEWIVEER
ncbi:PREDICTED: alpha-(1,3)-fucosyltransferase 10-like [Branchiostoma belcheri]|uniref:Fucosyltransferase n=1 Tax=Branchiostoma belcheri TaxID=7741 RepID=A0A6P4YL03_BRABE|nr:PREDICTED: alpha-(1,3)-fucosyltransferase 10-like [Branchiostoma belcheri]